MAVGFPLLIGVIIFTLMLDMEKLDAHTLRRLKHDDIQIAPFV